MLNKFFGSNTRVKILKLFLLNPDQKYYIRQIARDLKLQVNSARRELENLEKFGLLFVNDKPDRHLNKSNAKTNAKTKEKKYYQVNKNFILFNEIKFLIVKAQILYEQDFIKKLRKIGKIKLLILSGIFVNNGLTTSEGNQKAMFNYTQDIQPSSDILIVGKFHRAALLNLIKNLEINLNKQLNFTIMNVQEFKYRKDIGDMFLYGILENKKIVVVDEI